MKRRTWAALLGLFLIATACGEPSSRGAKSTPNETAGSGLIDWPDVDTTNMDCVVDYPEDLKARSFAFDGTIEAIELGEYDEDAGARPARMEVRVNEVFRGDIEGFIVMRTWDFMLPADEGLRGTRILAAVDHTLDLMGCGFTRPYSEEDAKLWRETFSGLPPEECGEEVRDCDLGEPSPVPAGCNRASYEYAIYSNIDAGSYPFETLGCNARYLALRVDLGADDCPPEATRRQRKRCADKKTAYFMERDGVWDLITYEDRTRCRSVRRLEPSFPTEFCRT